MTGGPSGTAAAIAGIEARGPIRIEGAAFLSGARLRCRAAYRLDLEGVAERVVAECRLLPSVEVAGRTVALPAPLTREATVDGDGIRVERLAFGGPLARLEIYADTLHTVGEQRPPGPDDPLDAVPRRPILATHRDRPTWQAAFFAAGTCHAHRDPAEAVAILAERLSRGIVESDGETAPGRPVGEILDSGTGRCLDRSRALLACLETVAIPARLASGHLIGSPDPHAWVEVRTRSGRWAGIDPSLGRWSDGRHVRLAAGPTPEAIALVRGRVWPADVGQRMTFRMSSEPVFG